MEYNKKISKKEKLEQFLMPLGMVGVVVYMIHIILSNILWPKYQPAIFISDLISNGAQKQGLLRVFIVIYGICIILFILGMIIKSYRKYKLATRVGYLMFLGMEMIFLFGYAAFPLTVDSTEMNLQNIMHMAIIMTVAVTSILSIFILAYGYIEQEKMKKLGKFVLIMAIIITLCGVLNFISVSIGLNILGLTEGLVIYSLQIFIFSLSFYYTKYDK